MLKLSVSKHDFQKFGGDIIKTDQVKLTDLSIFSSEQLKKLQEYNISSAEQFVGVCATPEGFNGIMQTLVVNQSTLNQMLYQVKNHYHQNWLSYCPSQHCSRDHWAQESQRSTGKQSNIIFLTLVTNY